jgi:hypothetical protein
MDVDDNSSKNETTSLSVTLAGIAAVEKTLEATVVGVSGNFTIRWEQLSSVSAGGTVTTIKNVGGQYIVKPQDENCYIRAFVRDKDGNKVLSNVIGPIKSASGSARLAVVLIGSVPAVGMDITATIDADPDARVPIIWQRITEAAGSIDIENQGTVYHPTAADEGGFIRAKVTDQVSTVYSNTIGPIRSLLGGGNPSDLAGWVTVTGAANVGRTLQADTTMLGGSGVITYRWLRCNTKDGTYVNIGASLDTYTLVQADFGMYIRVEVSREGSTGVKLSEPTGMVGYAVLTGSVTITREGAAVGTLLRANTTALEGSGAITYQWQRCSTRYGYNYANITSSSDYTLVQEDLGMYIRVVVTRAGYDGEVASEPVGPVSLPSLTNDSVTITGAAMLGQTLSANISASWAGDAIYQWQRYNSTYANYEDIANGRTYTLVQADVGKYIRVAVSRVGWEGTIVSASVLVELADNTLTGSVSISGNARVGGVLTANTTALGGSGVITYQWQRANLADGSYAPIGANSNTYTLVQADVGKYIRVVVSRTGYGGTKTAAPVLVESSGSPTGSVTIDGVAKMGQTLRVNSSALGGDVGTYTTYRWERSGGGGGFAAITNASSYTYTLVQADVGKYIRVVVSRTGYADTISDSVLVGVSALEGEVTISGVAALEQTLRANPLLLGVSKEAVNYQWQRFDAAGGQAITNANTDTYTLVQADVGKYIRVVVSSDGYDAEIASALVGPVGTPVLDGTVGIAGDFLYSGKLLTGDRLVANTTALGGNSRGKISYQWQRNVKVIPSPSPDSDQCHYDLWEDILGATSSVYLISSDNYPGPYFRVVVTREGYRGTVTSERYGPLLLSATMSPNNYKFGIVGDPAVGRTLRADVSSTVVGKRFYQWWRCDSENGLYERILGATSPTYVVTYEDLDKYIRVELGTMLYGTTLFSTQGKDLALGPIQGTPPNIPVPPAAGATVAQIKGYFEGIWYALSPGWKDGMLWLLGERKTPSPASLGQVNWSRVSSSKWTLEHGKYEIAVVQFIKMGKSFEVFKREYVWE